MKKEDILDVTNILSAIEENFKYQSPANTFMLVGAGCVMPLEEVFEEYDSEESRQWDITKNKIEESQKIMNLPDNWKELSGDEPEWRKIVDEILFPPFEEFRNWWFEKYPIPSGSDKPVSGSYIYLVHDCDRSSVLSAHLTKEGAEQEVAELKKGFAPSVVFDIQEVEVK